jgi:hypothetical protein
VEALPVKEVKGYLQGRVAQLEAIVQHITAHRAEQLAQEEAPRLAASIFNHSLAHFRLLVFMIAPRCSLLKPAFTKWNSLLQPTQVGFVRVAAISIAQTVAADHRPGHPRPGGSCPGRAGNTDTRWKVDGAAIAWRNTSLRDPNLTVPLEEDGHTARLGLFSAV